MNKNVEVLAKLAQFKEEESHCDKQTSRLAKLAITQTNY